MSFRIVLLCCVSAFVLILLSGTFIITRIENSTEAVKHAELTAAASEYSASLSVNGIKYRLNVPQNFSGTNRRVIVTDKNLHIVFDSYDIENNEGKNIFLSPAISAIYGDEYFDFKSSNLIMESSVASPVISDGEIIGTVCIFETDLSLKHVFNAFKTAVVTIDILIIIVLILLAIAIVSVLMVRISRILSSVRKTQEDEVIEKIPVNYHDEMTPIINEINDIYERLEYTQQMRQVFVSDASHELRTPLAAIRLLCESITQTENVDAETTREFMEDIILEVDRMSHTAEKLLVLSRLDSGSRTVFAPISLSDVVHKLITAFDPIAEAKSVTIESYIEDDCIISGDTEGTNQIVGNLIDNAIKYNNIGGTLRIYLFTKKDNCVFITDDTGIGIAPEFREHIFERFYRVDKSREHDGRGGSGLGLAIVKRNVEALGGTISVSNSVSGGTRFTVVFPSLTADEEVYD